MTQSEFDEMERRAKAGMTRKANASRSMLAANGFAGPAAQGQGVASLAEGSGRAKLPGGALAGRTASLAGFRITILGHIRGGKNNMLVTRDGHHVARKEWKIWRDAAVSQVQRQLPQKPLPWAALDFPVNIRLEYWAGDRRRRDMPAVIDSIWHVFEAARVVADDTHLWITESSRGFDPDNPRAIITFL